MTLKHMLARVGLVGALLLCGPARAADASAGPSAPLNQLSDLEKAAGWKLLFDGSATNHWRGFGKPAFPDKGWVVEDGWLKHRQRGGGGDLVTVETYNHFELEFDWRVGPGGNSGVKYFVLEARGEPIGHEYQLIDDSKYKGGGHKGSTASFYDVLAPATEKVLRAAGETNHTRILVQGPHVEHWLNGARVLEYELESEAVKAAIAQSKFRHVPGFGTNVKGRILLQDHGGEAWFRNLKIRELPAKQ